MYCIRRRVRVCTRLSEAAEALTTRDHVRGIGGSSTLLNSKSARGQQSTMVKCLAFLNFSKDFSAEQSYADQWPAVAVYAVKQKIM